MAQSKVAVLRTSPDTVLDDIRRVMRLADFEQHLPKARETILKINISWHFYYPACSTTPWQLDGVVRTLKEAGYPRLIPAQNRTVVIDPERGAVRNHHVSVMQKHGLDFVYLYRPEVEWVRYRPKAKMRVLEDVYRDEGILIPRLFIGKNAVHLPTMKTHVFTTTTGAMKNAFGGLLRDNRHWTHGVIHETLVDLLAIQQEIHTGLFAVSDGTIAGNGPGPRAMEPVIANCLLASADQVAIDAVAARIMGFDPMSIRYIRLATEQGLGMGELREVEIVGNDPDEWSLRFRVGNTFASSGQKLIYHGALKPLEPLLLRSPIVPWSYVASRLYHDFYWYPVHGHRRVRAVLEGTGWGRLFKRYARIWPEEKALAAGGASP